MWRRSRLEKLEIGLSFVQLREEALFGLELARVDAAAARFDADGVLEVEHLMVQQVLDSTAGGVGPVEDAGDDDGVVGGVVMAEHAACSVGGPGEGGASKKAMEEAGVEGFEDVVEIVMKSDGSRDAFASASLTDVSRALRDGVGGDVAPVAVGVVWSDGLTVELGQEDVRDCMVDGFGRGLKEV